MNEKISELNLIFPTPVWASLVNNHHEINEKMFDYIKKLESIKPDGIKKSNILGWHSENFNLEDKEPKFFFDSIYNNLSKAINDMGWDNQQNKIKVTAMWSIINKENASNSRHIHSNNFLSGAYYIKAPKNCGDILFHDPRDAKVIRKPITSKANKLNAEVVNISPQEGLLILFPSYLFHSVKENISGEERIVISFNIDLLSVKL
ncbi:MAG: hypothetical protein CFH18_00548 [Alphaproteobacteria bacterium MarineAlpha5_Bin8]|nr:MAG: hypothetical protein CFH17_00110 [Alphaproteobacteria bacterium MarineAlpha5_Bin7]PPR46695.1 MAG: hypothetical protein CFH18_00548 [Alphaproteobacteria bacterium MarineAlpha5_Bin8]PPR54345.1 MAG: hypothetical protein CFH16_00454 [Alphaproteobacteria bacterium MarineAlpha5_Bin6]|tara:strand:+ start:1769 stop:2383 length:615 start_codon:yes stop_codon:yes gene_type:complete